MEEIIQVSKNVRTTVVSYWVGTLPEITRLHFYSFKYNNDLNFKYILYSDISDGFKSSIPSSLNWLLDMPWFEHREIDLSNLMEKYEIPPFSLWKETLYYKLRRKLKHKLLSFLLKYSKGLHFRLLEKYRDLHLNEEIGFSFSHNQKFTGLSKHVTYRSDVFRSLIANEFTNENILYTDLDICFIRQFSSYDWAVPFTSPWGIARFANTAILFIPSTKESTRENILQEFRNTSAAWPWVLYSEKRCGRYDLVLRSIEEFDPPWSLSSPVSGDSSAFMSKRDNSAHVVTWVDEHSFCFHWHNQWKSSPEVGSPYDLYLTKFKN